MQAGILSGTERSLSSMSETLRSLPAVREKKSEPGPGMDEE